MSDRLTPPMSTHSENEPVPDYIKTDRRGPRLLAWGLLILSVAVLSFSLRSASLEPAQPNIIHVPAQPHYDHDDDDDGSPNMTLVSSVLHAPHTEATQ